MYGVSLSRVSQAGLARYSVVVASERIASTITKILSNIAHLRTKTASPSRAPGHFYDIEGRKSKTLPFAARFGVQ